MFLNKTVFLFVMPDHKIREYCQNLLDTLGKDRIEIHYETSPLGSKPDIVIKKGEVLLNQEIRKKNEIIKIRYHSATWNNDNSVFYTLKESIMEYSLFQVLFNKHGEEITFKDNNSSGRTHKYKKDLDYLLSEIKLNLHKMR